MGAGEHTGYSGKGGEENGQDGKAERPLHADCLAKLFPEKKSGSSKADQRDMQRGRIGLEGQSVGRDQRSYRRHWVAPGLGRLLPGERIENHFVIRMSEDHVFSCKETRHFHIMLFCWCGGIPTLACSGRQGMNIQKVR